MNYIDTTAPVPISDLKRRFSEDVEFRIDYHNSKFKGPVFLTYLSNLAIDFSLVVANDEELAELTREYLKSPVLLKFPLMVSFIMNLIMLRNGLPGSVPFEAEPFLEEHGELLDLWEKRLCMLPLYATFCLDREKFNPDDFEQDADDSVMGINWVHCIDHPACEILLGMGKVCYYNKHIFSKHMFAGKSLYEYIGERHNSVFYTLVMAVCPEIDHEFAKLGEEVERHLSTLMLEE